MEAWPVIASSSDLRVIIPPCLAEVSEAPAEERDHAASHIILECLHTWSVPLIEEGLLARAVYFVASHLIFL